MKIKVKDWLIIIILALIAFGFWHRLEYPRFTFIDLSFNKKEAIEKSIDYLKKKNVDLSNYSRAVVFDINDNFNRYFQHAVGLEAEKEFIHKHNFDLFCWIVRFFQESKKEEYSIFLSAKSGEVIRFIHLIEDTEARPDLGKLEAKIKAKEFLKNTFNADLSEYDFHEEKIKRYENRIEYIFSWEKKNVYIPWEPGKGGAKLLNEVIVSGDEVREFQKNKFDLPDTFKRYTDKQFILAGYINNIFNIFVFFVLAISISIVLSKKSDIVPQMTKKIFYAMAIFLGAINLAGFINNLQYIYMNYPTNSQMHSFLGLAFTKWLFNNLFIIVGFIMPGIAGEILTNETFPEKKYISFFSYLRSSFLNRYFSSSVLLGYLLWIITLGLQAIIFHNGQKFLGIWREWYTMAAFSSGSIPLLSALIIGANASLTEEITFRLFGISFAKKYLRNTILAILLASFVWGMGHTLYAIYPVWFRIIEITLIGLLYGLFFIRFGIVPVLVAHYLFDIFWCTIVYILGRSSIALFYSSLGLLLFPLLIALAAFFLNQTQKERPIINILSKTQKFNLSILVAFISVKKAQGVDLKIIKKELIKNNWDSLLVELAIKEIYQS
ncbi:MAG: CPBP family intramembrane glutamic endopeptidase [Candidatus Omnitrophota bacterium]